MKCIFIKQPYCDLILNGVKKYEIRSWKTEYRGSILICASKKPISPKYNNLNLGVTICIADLIDIIPFEINMEKMAKIKYIKNNWAWVFKNPRKVKNIYYSGRLGLFDTPTYLKVEVNR